MIIEISFLFLQFIIGLQCVSPTLEELRIVRERLAEQRSGNFRAPPMRRSRAFRVGQERPNVPIYPSRSNNQISSSSSNSFQNPDNFPLNGQRYHGTNNVSPILEVVAIEIPIAQAEPIPLLARFLIFISRNSLNRYNRFTNYQGTLVLVETEADGENIPIIRLYEPQETEPIRAQPLRFQF